MLPPGPEPLLIVILLASAALGWHLLPRTAGPAAYWVAGWAAAAISGALSIAGPRWPALLQLSHPAGSVYAGLMLAGALVFAERRVPRWLLPAVLAWGGLRASVAAAGHEAAALSMGMVGDEGVILAAAWIAVRAARRDDATRAERAVAPALALVALVGGLHLASLAAGHPRESLVLVWAVVVPPVLAIQIQAGADRSRRRTGRELEERVAERTAALLASEDRYRAISEISADLSFRVSLDPALRLRVDWAAGAVERITGRDPATLAGHGWLPLLPAEHRERLAAQLAAMPLGRRFELERRILAPDGAVRWIAIRVIALTRGADGAVVLLGSASDVTERRRAEAERRRLEQHLEQVQRLESLGVLAGGIAHDFNNLLTVVRGHAALALAELPPDAPLRARLERIGEAAGQAATLTEQMLAYAGKAPSTLGPLDVAGVVDSLAALLRASLPEGCTLDVACDPALPAVEADPGPLGQVVMNLVRNAGDAYGGRPGRVALSVRAETLDEAALEEALGHAPLAPGCYVVIAVRDAGCGMDAETRARVCEPFFSTKFSGRGLGMAAVLGIVRAHGGGLAIASAPGSGTTVRVLLPASERRPLAAPPVTRPPPAPAPRRGRVLVVDDDAAVRELAVEMLRRAGFEVATAAGGAEALALAETGARLDAAILDLAMPGLGGEATFLALRARRPELPVVLVSGYDAEHAAQRFAARGLDGFVRKPFEPEALVAAVEAAIARHPDGAAA